MRKITCFILLLTACIMGTNSVNAQCLEFDSLYDNTFYCDAEGSVNLGGAFCADSCAAGPFTLGDTWQLWTNEAYTFYLFPGAEYTFEFCENYDSTNWVAEVTAANYNYGEQTVGDVISTTTGCSLTFTVPDNPDDPLTPVDVIVIVANQADCGGATTENSDNGVFTFGCGANGGQPACDDIADLDLNPPACSTGCSSPELTIGEQVLSDTVICPIDTLFLNLDGVVFPNEGALFGFNWLIGTVPLTDASEIDVNNGGTVSFAFPLQTNGNITLIVPGGAAGLPVGTWYFTPMITGNTFLNDPETNLSFFPNLDFDCTQIGESIAVTFEDETAPSCDDGCPDVITGFECVDNEVYATVTVTNLGAYASVDITDGNLTETVSEQGGFGVFGPYPVGNLAVFSIITNDECNEDITLPVPALCTDDCEQVANGNFELGEQDWVADQFIVCDEACSTNGNNLAYDGSWWIWFGGFGDPNTSAVSQMVTIPEGPANLSFFLSIGNVDNNADILDVTIDGTSVLSYTGADGPDFEAYTQVSADVSDYADGEAHSLVFTSTTANTTSFFIDLISIEACGDACISDVGILLPPTNNEFAADESFVALAADYTDFDNYSYLFMLTDEDYNIVQVSNDGAFDLTALNGTYWLSGMSIKTEDIATIEGITDATSLNTLIFGGLICADILLADVNSDDYAIQVNAVGIEDPTRSENFAITTISPIPAQDFVNIDFSYTGSSNVTAVVYDMTGKLVATQQVSRTGTNNQVRLNTGAYTAGLYYITLSDGVETVGSKVVVK